MRSSVLLNACVSLSPSALAQNFVREPSSSRIAVLDRLYPNFVSMTIVGVITDVRNNDRLCGFLITSSPNPGTGTRGLGSSAKSSEKVYRPKNVWFELNR